MSGDRGTDAEKNSGACSIELERVSPEIEDAFISIWVESKMLPLRVGNRPVLVKALRVPTARYSHHHAAHAVSRC
jgi:hypothetical protein